MHSSVDTLRSSVLNLETQNESMRSAAADQEVVIQSLHTSFIEQKGLDESGLSERRSEARGGSIVEKLAVQQLIAASEARMLERSGKVVNELRTEVVELRVQLSQDLLEASAGAEARQDSVSQLRNELASLRSEVRSATMRAADQGASVTVLQEDFTTFKSSGGEAAASISEQAARLHSLQERLREVEDIAHTLQSSQREVGSEQGVRLNALQEKVESLEQATNSLKSLQQARSQAICQPAPGGSPPPTSRRLSEAASANASVYSDASSGGPGLGPGAPHGFEQRLQRLEEKVDASLPSPELEARVARLEEKLKAGTSSVLAAAPEGEGGAEADLEEPLTVLEARLSRIEDHIQSADPIEDYNFTNTSSAGAELPSIWSPPVQAQSAPPPQSSVVLRLSWAGEPQLPESDASTGLLQALRSALAAAPPAAAADMQVVRADLREEPGGGAPCGAVCWLSAADSRAAEAELRRQLRDPGSALRRQFPSLLVEDSSARQLISSAAHRSMLTRVDDLERSRELLAESLGDVEKRMLTVERLAAGGALGMDLGVSSTGNTGPPRLGDLSELGEDDSQEKSLVAPLPLSDGSALAPGSVVRTRRNRDSHDDDESSNDLDFEATSPGGAKDLSSFQLWEQEEAARKAKEEKKRRAREEAAAAQEEEQRRAEEEMRKAQEEQQRVEEEQRKAEEQAARLRAEEEQAARLRAEEEQQKAEEQEKREERVLVAWARVVVEAHERQVQESIAAKHVAKCAAEDAERARRAQEERAMQLAKIEARRRRVVGLPVVAKAKSKAHKEDVRKAFEHADTGGRGFIDHEDLRSFLADHLGFGHAEVASFHDRHGSVEGDAASRVVRFEDFCTGYGYLNPYRISQRRGEVIVRKPGSLDKREAYIEEVEDSEVYICEPTAQAFVDDCKRSLVLLGPCESSAFVRNCEDCTFWLAVQQLRTRDCRRCTFYLYSKTEPIIEASDELSFAPWAAAYPKCTAQFAEAGFDPQRNRWNAIFDFSGSQERSHWRILPLGQIAELEVELTEPPESAAAPDSPGPSVTHAALCAEPLEPEESCGESLGNIPQTRPSAPPSPREGVTTTKLRFQDDSDARPTLSKSLPRPAPAIFQAASTSQAVSSSPARSPTVAEKKVGVAAAAPVAADALGSPVGSRGPPDDMPEASPTGGIPASSLGDLSGTSVLQEGLEPAYSDDESMMESMDLPLSPGASPLQGRDEPSPVAPGSAAQGGGGGWDDVAAAVAEHKLPSPRTREVAQPLTTEEHISALEAELRDAAAEEGAEKKAAAVKDAAQKNATEEAAAAEAVQKLAAEEAAAKEAAEKKGVAEKAAHGAAEAARSVGHGLVKAEHAVEGAFHKVSGFFHHHKKDGEQSHSSEQAQQQAPASDGLRTPRVQGGMNAGEDSGDGSSDDVPPPMSARGSAVSAPPDDGSDQSRDGGRAPSAAAPTAAVDKRALVGEDSSEEEADEAVRAPSVMPKAAPKAAVDRRALFGEESSDEEEIERAAAPAPKAASAKSSAMTGSLSQLRPTAKSPMSHGAKLARYGFDEESDNEDVEEAISSWSAAAPTKSPGGASRGSPGGGLGKSLSSIGLNASRDSGADKTAENPSPAQAAAGAAKVGIGGADAQLPETHSAEAPLASSAGAEKSGASAGAASAGLDASGNSWDDSAVESDFGDLSAGAEAALGLRSPTAAEGKPSEAPDKDETAAAPVSATPQTASAAAMWSGVAEAITEHHLPTTEEAAAGSDGSVSEEEFDDGSDIDLP